MNIFTPLDAGHSFLTGRPKRLFIDGRWVEAASGKTFSTIPFSSIHEVIERSNKTSFGLGSGVWTQNVTKAHQLARGNRAGLVWINCY